MLTLFLGGDTMTGRGIDQILPTPVEPTLHESYVKDARDYVRLAEDKNGPVPAPVAPAYIWGEALEEIAAHGASVRLVNLETSVTTSDVPWPHKGVHYRMSPENIAALTALAPDVASLANNHVLDWGRAGLDETLRALRTVGVAPVGAGASAREAAARVIVERADPLPRRVIVAAACTTDCGVPEAWAAGPDRSGVAILPVLDEEHAAALGGRATAGKRPGDVVVVSLHWGSNWGHDIDDEQVHFAHRLIELGVDVVWGHSSHHPRAVERYGDGIILYGCGELIDDYEGIDGFEPYRSDLVLLYFLTFPDDDSGSNLTMTPMHIRKMKLERASEDERRFLRADLARASQRFGSVIELVEDGDLVLG